VTEPGATEGRPAAGAEAGIARIGTRLRDRMGRERPGLFAAGEWKGRVIARAMADEAFRVALFRFVDVLPAVRDDARLLALAQEYFEAVGDAAAQALGWTVKTLGRGGPFRKVAAAVLRRQVADLARQFIAGETVHAALSPIRRLWREGCGVSVDLLGEVTRTVALAVRLFGNIMSLEMAALLILVLAGFLVPVPILMLHIVEALVQAYIFGMLALLYIAGGIQSQQAHQRPSNPE